MSVQSIIVCPYCKNITFNGSQNGNIYCSLCSIILHYNTLEHNWAEALDDHGDQQFFNESAKLEYDMSIYVSNDEEND